MIRFAFALVAAIATLAPASAAPVPFGSRTVSIAARGQPVREFLMDLFSQAGLKAKVSSAVAGKINGVFVGTPDDIWRQVSRAYSVVMFYDGGTARIYSSSEVATRAIQTGDAAAVIADANRQQLVGGVNVLSGGNGLLTASGVPAFLDRIEQLASARMKPAAAAVAAAPPPMTGLAQGMVPAVPGAVASPLTRAPVQRGAVRSEVMVPSTGRSPYEMRIFYLKYRQPSDVVLRGGNSGLVLRGMVSLLREQMGYGGTAAGAVTGGSRRLGRQDDLAADPDEILDDRLDRRRARYDEAGDAPRAPATTLDGPRITADDANKAVIVRDRPEVMGTYEALIANLDFEPPLVETTVTILELDRDELKTLGLDFAFSIGGVQALFGGDLLGNGNDIQGSYLRGRPDAYAVRIQALEQKGALRVVKKPILLTPSNQEVLFSDRTNTFVPLVGERQVGVENFDFGLLIRLNPSVIEDGGTLRVQMGVEIEDTRILSYGPGGTPIYGGPSIATQVTVPHGESVLIVGMSQTTDFDYKSKTPILGDIPVLGQAFRKRNKGQNRIEKLFLLTPRIISTQSADVVQASASNVIPLEQIQNATPATARRARR